MPEDLKDIDARLHALQQFLKQVGARVPGGCAALLTALAGKTEVSHGTIVNMFFRIENGGNGQQSSRAMTVAVSDFLLFHVVYSLSNISRSCAES